MEYQLKESFNITRDDIVNGAKNPYKKAMLRDVIIGLVIMAVSVLLKIFVSTTAAVCTAASTGVLATHFSTMLMNSSKYKKMQKEYMSGELDEERIRAAVMMQLYEERQKLWNR